MHEGNDWQLISLVNLSGQIGTSFTDIVPVFNLTLEVKTPRKPEKISALYSGTELEFTCCQDGYVKILLPRMELLETLVVFFLKF